jgi:hypothetical protein
MDIIIKALYVILIFLGFCALGCFYLLFRNNWTYQARTEMIGRISRYNRWVVYHGNYPDELINYEEMVDYNETFKQIFNFDKDSSLPAKTLEILTSWEKKHLTT